ncbi:hypothetical protein TPHA_0B03680 [Tetrapisispora phaffii CBS 4417]|uniref:Uncharacterized protein n=1 Tax=Tetrapisispora phaffii (strain ATCC 24235 / CBS 4417 / NBRC 1672 / NRRL Y-8282 / UCD 70-5) TaxID=1071381 RepID=G8BPV9_TETPH|nr:hypothetical protein TPHA_0B03680 [Tetrapisispora phaffii CBS 4417]CCE62040.1 hypothetical protein TPHA_0B03680 [Tetrapisispora phaffii CBS 4417]
MFPSLSVKQLFWMHIFMLSVIFAYRKREYLSGQLSSLRNRYNRRYIRSEGINSSFSDDIEAGLSSTNFDLESGNVGDQREGLDDIAKEEIKKIMAEKNLSFDAARLAYTEEKFGKNNIAADGMPKDPKTVTLA